MHEVKRRRKAAGWSVSELAKYTGLSQGTIRHIENNTSDFKTNLGVAMLLAQAFGCEIHQLFSKEELSHLGRPPLTGHPTTTVTCVTTLSTRRGGMTETISVSYVRTGNICEHCWMQMPVVGECQNCN